MIRRRLIESLYNDLIGSCRTLDEALDGKTLNGDELLELEGLTVKCGICDWWVEPDEVNSDGECEDCAVFFGEYDDDEENDDEE